MSTVMTTKTNLQDLIAELGAQFADAAPEHDSTDAFVDAHYTALKERGWFGALVPEEFGGGGATHREMCAALRALGSYCSSTALATSMQQHLVAAQVFNNRAGKPNGPLLERIAKEQLVLISTGATDWVNSNGSVEKVEGGFRVSAAKVFASGSPHANIYVTSAPYDCPDDGPSVLHFPVPASAEGVSLKENWEAMGMRGTGSNTAIFDNVFVPEESVQLKRPQDVWPAALDVVLVVAMPIIMSVYAGIAERAARIARDHARKKRDDVIVQGIVGEMENALTATQVTVDSMVELANDYDFEPCVELTNEILKRKTIAAKAAHETVELAMEAAGGAAYFRATGLERLLRDIRAAEFHPLPERRQQRFSGRISLGLDPVEKGQAGR